VECEGAQEGERRTDPDRPPNQHPNRHPPGPLPPSIRNAANLADFVMPYHKISGMLPVLPDNLVWLDLKSNQIARLPGGFNCS
jgi:hypothetical protein